MVKFDEPLRVKHTVTIHGKPLACFANLPGYDAEMTSEQVRAFATALLRIADDCEALRDEARRYGPKRREYEMTPAPRRPS
jgi:hypothetical protein